MNARESAILEARRQLDAAVAADRYHHTEETGKYRRRCWARWRRCCGHEGPPPVELSDALIAAQEAVDEAVRVYAGHPNTVTFQVLMAAQKRRNEALDDVTLEMGR